MPSPLNIAEALSPARSAVVEACAGSGKTWLLVSRMIRLLLAGAPPSVLLAITFTPNAAQEITDRLHEWLWLLERCQPRDFESPPTADILTKYYRSKFMETTSVTSKGQVTIPKSVRQQLGIRQGSRVEFSLVGDHVEMRIRSTPAEMPASGFGMLSSRKRAVPADFDPAELLKK